jgi:hypothetical protein
VNFRPELAAKVMAGQKTVTRRLCSENPRSPWWTGGCKLQVGRDYAVCPGRGKDQIGRVQIRSVTREPLGHPSDHEAQLEGLPNAESFESTFEAINGKYDPDAIVWRIEFRGVAR